MSSKRYYLIAIALFSLGVLVGIGGTCLVRQPTPEENKAALKAAMLEALPERFPVFPPRGDRMDIEEERRRRDADPTDPALIDRCIEEQKEAEERIREAAEIGPHRLMHVVAVELNAAMKRGGEMERRGR